MAMSAGSHDAGAVPQPPGVGKKRHGARPTVDDGMSDALTPLAQQYWAPGAGARKPFDADIIQQIYTRELSSFDTARVAILEFSQYFEKSVALRRGVCG